MAHEIEANFIEESKSDTKQCQFCDSFETVNGVTTCKEYNEEVPEVGYCDFFRSLD